VSKEKERKKKKAPSGDRFEYNQAGVSAERRVIAREGISYSNNQGNIETGEIRIIGFSREGERLALRDLNVIIRGGGGEKTPLTRRVSFMLKNRGFRSREAINTQRKEKKIPGGYKPGSERAMKGQEKNPPPCCMYYNIFILGKREEEGDEGTKSQQVPACFFILQEKRREGNDNGSFKVCFLKDSPN